MKRVFVYKIVGFKIICEENEATAIQNRNFGSKIING